MSLRAKRNNLDIGSKDCFVGSLLAMTLFKEFHNSKEKGEQYIASPYLSLLYPKRYTWLPNYRNFGVTQKPRRHLPPSISRVWASSAGNAPKITSVMGLKSH